MITLNCPQFNLSWLKSEKELNKNYNQVISDFIKQENFHSHFELKGYYSRSIRFQDASFTLRILVVTHLETNTCHALLPDFLVPFRQVLLLDIQALIKYYMTNNRFNYDSILLDSRYGYHLLERIFDLPSKSDLSYYSDNHLYYLLADFKHLISHKLNYIELPRQLPNKIPLQLSFDMLS